MILLDSKGKQGAGIDEEQPVDEKKEESESKEVDDSIEEGSDPLEEDLPF